MSAPTAPGAFRVNGGYWVRPSPGGGFEVRRGKVLLPPPPPEPEGCA